MIIVAKRFSSLRNIKFKELFKLARAEVKTLSSVASESHSRRIVLGIETSCDDTGAAVVDEYGNILGEALHSQMQIHTEKYGGVHPLVAKELHAEYIDPIVCEALKQANVKVQDCDAIAVTVKPGFMMSLYEGVNYAKKLAAESGKPLIPIHHMEAHALTPRMLQRIEFPFLVMLISGGHCLLAVARGINDFLLLGKSLDIAPGDALDKVARTLNLKSLPQCAGLSGGAAIEKMAEKGKKRAFDFPSPRHKTANCDFLFSSLYYEIIRKEEQKYGVKPGEVVPSVADLCASVQYSVTLQLVRKLQRAYIFCMENKLISTKSTMVLSGGVACNQFIRRNIMYICRDNWCHLVCPPPNLCTDNGVMIAWNGMEKLLQNIDMDIDPSTLIPERKSPLGVDIRDQVVNSEIKLKRIKVEIV